MSNDRDNKQKVQLKIEGNVLLKTNKDIENAKRLYKLVVGNMNSFFWLLKRKENKELSQWLCSKTLLLNDPSFKYTFGTRCYWIFNGLTDFPKCEHPECNNKIGIHANCSPRGYQTKHCCNRCKTLDPKVQALIIATSKKRYGNDCVWTAGPQALAKRKATCKDQFGYDNVFAAPETIEQIAWTIAKNHSGNSKYRNHKQGVMTRKDIYGQGSNGKAISESRNSFSEEKWNEINKKIGDTKEANHGDRNYNNSEQMVKTRLENNNGVYTSTAQKESARLSYLKTCGYDHNFKDPKLREKLRHKKRSIFEFDGKQFDSRPELAYYVWLKDNNIDFQFHLRLDFKFEYEGVIHEYWPDFLVEGQIIEIKGNQFFLNKDPTQRMVDPFNHARDGLIEAKHLYMISIGVKIMTAEDYLPYIQYVETMYGKNFFKLHKRQKISTSQVTKST